MSIPGFSQKWKDFPDFIIGITREIWEDRGIGTLKQYYAQDIPVRSPMGIQNGNKEVMASTLATLHEFPDRQLFGEDVIWCGNETDGYLSSHRIISTGTHLNDGVFGKATGKKFKVRIIADCAALEDTIYDEWLVRDYGGIVRQLGFTPKKIAAKLIKLEGGPDHCSKPFLPENNIEGKYKSTGNENIWGQRYAQTLKRIMAMDINTIGNDYDRAVTTQYAGGKDGISWESVQDFWLALRSAFPNAEFTIHHQIGMDADMLPPRAAIRWSLDGKHEGLGAFGKPTGARVHVMGISHAEFGPFVENGTQGDATIRRECALYDEIAIWKQILMHTGAGK